MYFTDKKSPFGIFGETHNTEVEPTFRINPITRIHTIMDTGQSVLKLRYLFDELYITRIEIAVYCYESLTGA